jgi:hypothetical protein
MYYIVPYFPKTDICHPNSCCNSSIVSCLARPETVLFSSLFISVCHAISRWCVYGCWRRNKYLIWFNTGHFCHWQISDALSVKQFMSLLCTSTVLKRLLDKPFSWKEQKYKLNLLVTQSRLFLSTQINWFRQRKERGQWICYSQNQQMYIAENSIRFDSIPLGSIYILVIM